MARKVWISGNEIIRRNSEEETMRELHGNGYLSRLYERIRSIDAAIKEEDEARRKRAEARAAAKARAAQKKAAAEEMEM